MNIKHRALRLIGKRKLESQFDDICSKAITDALIDATAEDDGIHDLADIMRLTLERRFERIRDSDRLIRSFMVIDSRSRPTIRGIINVQSVIGDGYTRYQYEIVNGLINVSVSHIVPRYV